MGRVSGGLLVLACVLGLAAWWRSTPPQGAVALTPAARAPDAVVRTKAAWNPVPDAAATPHDPSGFARWLDEQSSLRGTALDGSWDVDGQGRFRPTLALRRRFDQLLTLAGEARIEEITAFIEHDVRELAGAYAAAAVLDAWQRYLALQGYAWRNGVRLGDRESLAAALAERQQVRRRILGVALAQAFFAEDEAQLQAMLQGREATPDVLTTRIDRRQLGPEALARLQAEEAAWSLWQRRFEAVRREIESLQAAPELSPPQRAQAVERLLAQRFDPQEAVRVRALLHLPPAS